LSCNPDEDSLPIAKIACAAGSVKLRELGFAPIVAIPMQDFRHLGNDLNQKYQFLPEFGIVNSVECLQEPPRLFDMHLPVVDGSGNTGQQAAEQLVDLLAIYHVSNSNTQRATH
jgi:hypothetical protein